MFTFDESVEIHSDGLVLVSASALTVTGGLDSASEVDLDYDGVGQFQ